MKRETATLVALALLSACRSRPPAVAPEAALGPPGGVATARITVDSARSEVILLAGPFQVPQMGMSMDHAHMDMPMGGSARAGEMAGMEEHGVHAYSPLIRFAWPVDGWYRGYRVSLMDSAGRPLPRSLAHHVDGVNFDRRQLVTGQVERFLASGRETKDIVLPRFLGVPMRAGATLGVWAAWHNELGRDFSGVYIRIEMPYTSARSAFKPLSGFPVLLDVNDHPGGSDAFDVPPGHSERRFDFTIPLDGRFLAMSGHLHDFGREVRLEDAETGKVLLRLPGVSDSAGHLVAMPSHYFLPLGLKVHRGQRLRVVGEYDSPEPDTRPAGGMALLAGFFVPANVADWPALDESDAAMRADLESLPGGPKALAPVIGSIRQH